MNKDFTGECDPAAPVSEQASHWCVLLSGGNATRADKKAFGEWVSRSPERIEAYIQATRLTKALKSKQIHWEDTPVETLIREAKEELPDVVPLFGSAVVHSRLRSSGKHRKPPLLLALAASVLAIFAVSWMIVTAPVRYSTAVGEQRSVVLNDGSVVTLNTSSRIEVRFGRESRTIKLLDGEALFEVARDKLRPFDVIAGATTVRALGTQFNVDRRTSATTVTVVEGKVSVEHAQSSHGPTSETGAAISLSAGEEVVVRPSARLQSTAADVATATAWTQRRLVFEHRPLGEVADEFNRYNRQVIRIQSTALREQEITGVFQANDRNSFLDFIAKIPGVRIEQIPEGTSVVTYDR